MSHESKQGRAKPVDYLSREQLAEIRDVSNLRGLGSIAWTWGWILASFAYYVVDPGPLSFLVGWVIMSGRHLALAILMHEGAHGLILRNREWNDRVTQWLTAYPVMVEMLLYRKVHVQHHRHTWTDADPDRYLATPFPVTPASFRRKMIRDLSGQTAWDRHRVYVRYAAGLSVHGKGLEGKSLATVLGNFVRVQRGFLLTNAVLLGGLTLAGAPEAYLLLWMLPLWTGYSAVLRIRSIAEHACVTDTTDPLRQTRTTLAPGWLRFLIAPHHVNYHLEHHLFMSVPHYRLPTAHRMLAEAGLLEKAEIAPSYFSVLKRAMSKTEDAVPAVAAA